LEIFTVVGKDFDIDSQQVLSAVLREVADVGGYIGPSRITASSLEHLAIAEPVARLIAKFKRLHSEVVRLESISAAVRDGKIYLFSIR
jgi:hypothetical protein